MSENRLIPKEIVLIPADEPVIAKKADDGFAVSVPASVVRNRKGGTQQLFYRRPPFEVAVRGKGIDININTFSLTPEESRTESFEYGYYSEKILPNFPFGTPYFSKGNGGE